MPPLAWLLLGLLLLAVELFTPGGFYLLFFGIGALIVGALLAVLPEALIPSFALQIAIFLMTSLAGLMLLRNALIAKFGRRSIASSSVDNLADTVGVALEDLQPGGAGKVELRGAAWSARNTGSVPLVRGQRCAVERVDGLTLWVRLAPDEFLAPFPRKEQAT